MNAQTHTAETLELPNTKPANDVIWPAPEKIECEMSPVTPLPLSIIPGPYRAWIADVSHRMQAPPDMAAAGAIVMTGAVIGAGCGIRPKSNDDWLVIPNLFGGAVGRPSIFMKSPTQAEIMKPLARLEAEAKEQFETEERHHDGEVEMAEVERAAIRKKMAESVKSGSTTIEDLKAKFSSITEPAAPVWKRYRTNDATIEKLSELLNENSRGILVCRDELTALLNSWEKSGHEQDRAFYLEGWNGHGDFYVDRIGRGTIHTPNMCLSIFGGIQPAKLQQYLYANRVANDGMFQRFQMLVCPDEPASWELIDKEPDRGAKNRAFDIVKTLAEMDFTKHGAVLDDGDKIPYFRFAEDAQAVFYDWLTQLETEKIRGQDEAMLVEHFAKYRKLMPALSLIFHLIDVANKTASGPVTAQATKLAAAWCDYLEEHARRIYGLVQSTPMQAAASLARRVARGEVKENTFTARDIYRNQWAQLTDKDVVQAACDILVDKNWLREDETPAAYQQRGKIEYTINPKTRGFYG